MDVILRFRLRGLFCNHLLGADTCAPWNIQLCVGVRRFRSQLSCLACENTEITKMFPAGSRSMFPSPRGMWGWGTVTRVKLKKIIIIKSKWFWRQGQLSLWLITNTSGGFRTISGRGSDYVTPPGRGASPTRVSCST